MIPFAVVGSDQEYQVNGRRLLGRKTKWGTIEGTDAQLPLPVWTAARVAVHGVDPLRRVEIRHENIHYVCLASSADRYWRSCYNVNRIHCWFHSTPSRKLTSCVGGADSLSLTEHSSIFSLQRPLSLDKDLVTLRSSAPPSGLFVELHHGKNYKLPSFVLHRSHDQPGFDFSEVVSLDQFS